MFDKVLALDLGTNLGWAVLANGITTCGSECFKPTRFESAGMRFLRFKKWLSEKIAVDKPEIIVFEQVYRHLGTTAAHVYGGLLGILQATCEEKQIPYRGFDVGKIKITATGKGNADKFAMIAAAKAKWPDLAITSSDAADALFVLETAKNQI